MTNIFVRVCIITSSRCCPEVVELIGRDEEERREEAGWIVVVSSGRRKQSVGLGSEAVSVSFGLYFCKVEGRTHSIRKGQQPMTHDDPLVSLESSSYSSIATLGCERLLRQQLQGVL